MPVHGCPCIVCAVVSDNKVQELRLEPFEKKSILGNIYVGKTEEIAANIRAAFIRFADGQKGYMPLSEGDRAIYTSGRKGERAAPAGRRTSRSGKARRNERQTARPDFRP